MKVSELKDLHNLLCVSLPSDKKKPSLFANLRDSDKTKMIDNETFEYEVEELPVHLQKGPRWEILTGMEIDVPSGFYPSGVEDGFFAPTKKDNNVGVAKMSYLTEADERIKRPEFAHKPRDEAHRRSGRPQESTSGPPNEKGHPSTYVRSKLLRNFCHNRPKDYFDTQITPEFVESFTTMTNQRAAPEGAGSRTYRDWAPFDSREVYKMLGLVFANAVSPKPQLMFWFLNSTTSRIFGNDFFANSLDKKLQVAESSRAIDGGLTSDTSCAFMTFVLVQKPHRRRTHCGRLRGYLKRSARTQRSVGFRGSLSQLMSRQLGSRVHMAWSFELHIKGRAMAINVMPSVKMGIPFLFTSDMEMHRCYQSCSTIFNFQQQLSVLFIFCSSCLICGLMCLWTISSILANCTQQLIGQRSCVTE